MSRRASCAGTAAIRERAAGLRQAREEDGHCGPIAPASSGGVARGAGAPTEDAVALGPENDRPHSDEAGANAGESVGADRPAHPEEWVAELPLRSQLACPDALDQQARLWRDLFQRLAPPRERFPGWFARPSGLVFEPATMPGQELVPLVRSLLSVSSPERWTLYPSCAGSGTDAWYRGSACFECKGTGFHIEFIPEGADL
jgi:hypothetical protein